MTHFKFMEYLLCRFLLVSALLPLARGVPGQSPSAPPESAKNYGSRGPTESSKDPKLILEQAAKACAKLRSVEYTYVREYLSSNGPQIPPMKALVRQKKAAVPTVWIPGKFSATGEVTKLGKITKFSYAYNGKIFWFVNESDNTVSVGRSPEKDVVGNFLSGFGLGIYTFPEFSDPRPMEEFRVGIVDWTYGGTQYVGGILCDVITRTNPRTVNSPRGKVDIQETAKLLIAHDDHLPRRFVFETVSSRVTQISQVSAYNLWVNRAFADSVFALQTPPGYTEKLLAVKEAPPVELLPVGSVAPTWKLTDVNGQERSLSDYAGKVLIIDFWATWCAPCLEAMPTIQRLNDKFGKRGVAVLGVDVMDDGKLAEAYMKQKSFDYTLLINGDAMASSYNALALPTIYIIGGDGRIVYAEKGYHAERKIPLDKIVNDLLTEK